LCKIYHRLRISGLSRIPGGCDNNRPQVR
jgi:hypothetical protein